MSRKSRSFEQETVPCPDPPGPGGIYMVLLVGFPFLMAFVYSFSNVTVGNPDFKFVGMRNFVEPWSRTRHFQTSLLNTCIFTFISIVLVLVLSNILPICSCGLPRQMARPVPHHAALDRADRAGRHRLSLVPRLRIQPARLAAPDAGAFSENPARSSAP